MALTADEPRDFQTGNIETYPVEASEVIYEGAVVGENASGYAQASTGTNAFLGIAIRQADNSTGAAGDVTVDVLTEGRMKVTITGAITDNDRVAVYASDDGTFTKTSASNAKIGWYSRWIDNSTAIIQFRATEA